jgi:uncharacterized protein
MLSVKLYRGSEEVTDREITRKVQADYTFDMSFRVVEDDPFLRQKLVRATLDWGDGTPVIAFPAQVSPLNIVPQENKHVFQSGFYAIRLRAENFRYPTVDTALMTVQLTVVGASIPTQSQPTVYGPILPRDAGFPNREQWSLNSSDDLRILESSVRMLLLTDKGERLMEPDYGTNIRQYIFDSDSSSSQASIQHEIVSAINLWEPRVSLMKMNIKRDGQVVTVDAQFVSRLTNQVFKSQLQYVYS